MSLEKLPARSNGQNIDETWFNLIKRILGGVIAPRNTDGEVTARAGSLGSATYRWKRLHCASGYFFPGAIKYKYKYTGITWTLERGWMLMDGRIINEANYNAEHGAGAWAADGIADSPIAGKYLPNIDGRYIRGVIGETLNTQSGASAITPSGAGSVDISHTHGSGTITSSWANNVDPTTNGTIIEETGNDGRHTHNVTLTTLSTSVNTGPTATEVNLFMRVI